MMDPNLPISMISRRDGLQARGWFDEVLGFSTADLTPDEVDRLRPHIYRWSLHNKDIGYHKIHDAYTVTQDGEPLVCEEATRGALYIIRNPLDVAPSYAKHNHSSVDAAISCMGDPEHALSKSRDKQGSQVRQFIGSWSDHVLSWVDAPKLNCHVLRYEDMQASPMASFTQAARFLELPENGGRIAKAIRFSAFNLLAEQEVRKGFRERPPKTGSFFRQGTSGGWRQQLTDEQVDRIVSDHRAVMQRFGYLDDDGRPI
jgi:hypothetical protein